MSKDSQLLQKLCKNSEEHNAKQAAAWQRCLRWVGSFNWFSFFPFTFWVWKSGWHAKRVLVLEAKLKKLRARPGFDIDN